MIIRTNCYKFL
uniref:Uncharacterized protein n=1 Tax=Rhizophora mucronata TaxID=61149 RepID=A0A2P2QKS7_RHIMU